MNYMCTCITVILLQKVDGRPILHRWNSSLKDCFYLILTKKRTDQNSGEGDFKLKISHFIFFLLYVYIPSKETQFFNWTTFMKLIPSFFENVSMIWDRALSKTHGRSRFDCRLRWSQFESKIKRHGRYKKRYARQIVKKKPFTWSCCNSEGERVINKCYKCAHDIEYYQNIYMYSYIFSSLFFTVNTF